VLVTGGAGFAGRQVVQLLRERGDDVAAPPREQLDLLDAEGVEAFVREQEPTLVFHLAAQASVPASWRDPRTTLVENLDTTLNLLEAVRLGAPEAVVVMAGSGEVYGAPERLPVEESAPLRPRNPYALSKAACDLLGAQYAEVHGLRVVRLRAFNQAGPAQSDEYVVGTLARQVAEAELRGGGEAVLRLGNLDSARDFTDVRDAARAQLAAAEAEPEAYNVCSGRAVKVRGLVDMLAAAASVEVRAEVDESRVRADDVAEIRGSSEKLRAATGWEPEIPLERTVADALGSWRERLSGRTTAG
jgi:GDP-4-dehydro-6-deoxy-D-mannose reductase